MKFEIQKYYRNKTKFRVVYSRDSLLKLEDEIYIMTLDECQSIWTHSLALSVNGDSATYLASFGVEYIPKDL